MEKKKLTKSTFYRVKSNCEYRSTFFYLEMIVYRGNSNAYYRKILTEPTDPSALHHIGDQDQMPN